MFHSLDKQASPAACIACRCGCLALVLALALQMTGCAAENRTNAPVESMGGKVVGYRFPLPDGNSVGDREMLGRRSIILFVTTYDTISQAITQHLEEMRHSHTPRINVLAVALEPPQNAPLVAVYRETLNLGYPVALADQDTLEGQGPFGDVRAVPAIVLLDAQSRIVLRGFGVEALEGIAEALRDSDNGGH